ncbi:MAG TPA: glycosyltransferase family 39 protein [Thermoflexales bacterium]|nr:glycosyltransferase family 39 protein [Thermoflexales bacterium]HQW33916.1 glycosyltransferase family 39 protein [Thermoflexales bacterium]HQZ21262.1 glycosyltransferase family 39 protein [Thermoflexales bacterium]HQZ98688.1 glycosyltransferase family 39 protein [Thermoflexales bacterium]
MKKFLNIGAVGVFATLFIIASSHNIALPGLQYDELLFVKGSLFWQGNWNFQSKIGSIPVMIMPYIGALKAFLYTPLFLVFGVNAETIRLPAILISAGSILVGAAVVNTFSKSRWPAILMALLMSTDFTYIILSKADYGPIVLMIFFKLLALLMLFKLIITRKLRYVILILVFFTLGLYDKLNFIWIVLAYTLASIVIFPSILLNIWRTEKLKTTALIAVFIAIILFFGVHLSLPLYSSSAAKIAIRDQINHAIDIYINTLSGVSLLPMLIAKSPDISYPQMLMTSGWKWPLYAIPALFACALALTAIHISSYKTHSVADSTSGPVTPLRAFGFIAIVFLAISLQIILTREAGGPHHIMALWPFHHMLVVILFAWLAEFAKVNTNGVKKNFFRVLTGLAFAVISLIGAWQGNISVNALHAIDTATRFTPIWTSAIYSLVEYVEPRASTVEAIYTADWGMGTQIFSLAPESRSKIFDDVWPIFLSKNIIENETGQNTYQKFFKEKKGLLLLHTQESEILPKSHANTLAFIQANLPSAVLVKTITDGSGSPVFEVYYWDE